ncbi:hypothetical protein ABOM_010661 [Aspergillus bombycis]|uniref:Uncharacterized protein n=1 Tax=Aspergillus bombycis TaxID=109264 RepID=A0A1F7ZMB7_9EURO|nr:hypothetical protein ABOM_010661 [Aspergillus bombycis]OGM40590.1 hypothetical protein ABOM_010661 [Aspergillus bombycis]
MSVAAKCGTTSTAKFLLQHDADANPGSKCGRLAMYESPLLCAVRKGHVTIIKLLHAHGVSLQDREEDQDTYGLTPRTWECRQGHIELIELLVEKGADPSFKDAGPSFAGMDMDSKLEYIAFLGIPKEAFVAALSEKVNEDN